MKKNRTTYPPHLKPLKYFAMALFVLLPFVGFYVGMNYQKFVNENKNYVGFGKTCTLIKYRCPEQSKAFVDNIGCGCKKGAKQNTGSMPITTLQQSCGESGGTWVSEFNECEGLSAQQCTSKGGTFSECASPCRHDSKAEICVQMCVPVCKF
jgi:hypothetical protein